jgi:NADH dehydrogenase
LVLVDRLPYHQLLPRLPDVAVGKLPASKACIPFTRILGRRVRRLHVSASQIDLAARRLSWEGGELEADWLLLTPGSAADPLDVPGALTIGLPLKSVEQARGFARLLLQRIDTTTRPKIVVVGSGYTGTELAGELADPGTFPPRPSGAPPVDVTVVSLDSRLLAEGNERLAGVAERVLRAKGVRFLLGVAVRRVDQGGVVLESGSRLAADLVVWAARTRAPREVADSVDSGNGGRIEVDSYLRVPGHERVYAAGDAALVRDYHTGRWVASTAQLALGQADVIARNIAAEIEGRPLREYRALSLGEALSLGGTDGAAEVGGVIVTGRAAIAAKRAALARYLYNLGGVRLVRDYA